MEVGMSGQNSADQMPPGEKELSDGVFYRRHFELSPIPGVVLNLKGECLLVNHAFENLFDISQDVQARWSVKILKFFEDQGEAEELLNEVWEKQVVRRREMKLVSEEGQRFTMLLSGRSLLFKEQPSVELLFMDITRQKRIERQLRRERARRVSLMDGLVVGLFQVDMDGKIIETNLELSNLLGFDEGSVVGRPYQELLGLMLSQALEPEVVQQSLSEAIIRVAEKPTINIVLHGEPSKHLEMQFLPIWDEDGTSLGWVGTVQDVTEVRERMRWKLELLSILAHDIRAPLATLKGQATALVANFRHWGEEMVEDFLEGINRSTDKLIHQVERSLALTRVETGRLGLRPESCSVNTIVERALERVEGILGERTVVVKIPAELPKIRVDPARIEEVLINLLENSVRYSPPNRPITIQAEREKMAIKISVTDQGIGVPKDIRHEIFEKYVGEGSEGDGSGLGLYISRRIIEEHGGKIWVESPPPDQEEGARFLFTLPIMPEITSDELPRIRKELGLEQVPEGDMRVLIVEDEPDFQVLLRTILNKTGYQTEVAPDGQTTLDIIQTSPPDMILLDWMLPGMDGLNLCRNIRRWTNAPILMVTSKTSQEDLIKALDAGADDYITKPFRTPELLARIQSAARRREMWADEEPDRFNANGLTVNFDTQEVWMSGQRLELTPTELNLLIYMARNRGQVLTYELLLDHLYGTDKEASLHNLFVHVSRLRKKIEPDPEEPRFIITRWGLGYVFMPT
jgi:two-component system response regulator VicR